MIEQFKIMPKKVLKHCFLIIIIFQKKIGRKLIFDELFPLRAVGNFSLKNFYNFNEKSN